LEQERFEERINRPECRVVENIDKLWAQIIDMTFPMALNSENIQTSFIGIDFRSGCFRPAEFILRVQYKKYIFQTETRAKFNLA
jgi:folate-binding Fe-S cluster repair protein YgfZ